MIEYYVLYKRNKKLVPRTLLSYISTREFLRTLEKCEKHSLSARASPHFSRDLKNSRVLVKLNNALGAFFISLTKSLGFASQLYTPIKHCRSFIIQYNTQPIILPFGQTKTSLSKRRLFKSVAVPNFHSTFLTIEISLTCLPPTQHHSENYFSPSFF